MKTISTIVCALISISFPFVVINSKTALGGWSPHIYPNRQEMTHISVLFLIGVSIAFIVYQYLRPERK